MKITIVSGARPNFMKIAPIIRAIQSAQASGKDIHYRLVHTGQHYDKKMSEDFFEQLNIPTPDVNLGCGSGSQAEQTGAVMMQFECELLEHRPNIVLVVGDVTSTMACTITAKKLCIDVAHVEAGIRSGDMTMPEEVNRMVTDSICDYFFTTTESAFKQLQKNGIDGSRIYFVGNTMIDTLYYNIDRIIQPDIWEENHLSRGKYFLVTLHRPSNVDNVINLKNLLDVILRNTNGLPVIFPIHPRTKKILDSISYAKPNLIQTDPLGYLQFVYLMKNAKAVITDSGGITEETTVLKVPCLTLRNSTERPETVSIGSNELVGINPSNLKPYLHKLHNGIWKPSGIPPLWDGKTAERIITLLIKLYSPVSIVHSVAIPIRAEI